MTSARTVFGFGHTLERAKGAEPARAESIHWHAECSEASRSVALAVPVEVTADA
jgi:hypothetical protein